MVKPLKSLPKDFAAHAVTEDGERIFTPTNPSEAMNWGAEGSIFPLNEVAPDGSPLSLKIYHPKYINDRIVEKIEAMTRADHLRKVNKSYKGFLFNFTSHPRVAAYTKSGKCIGYVMKHFPNAYTLAMIQNKKTFGKFVNPNYSLAVNYAKALPLLMIAVHEAGYIIGDMNPKNFIVVNHKQVHAVDVDSFQFKVGSKLYRSSGRVIDWLYPDLHLEDWTKIELKPEHDYFALAKLIFQLLMFGEDPYAGVYNDKNREVTAGEAVRYRHYPYNEERAKQVGIKIRPGAINPKVFSKKLAKLFDRAFLGTLEDIPQPHEWVEAIEALEANLTQCTKNDTHSHHRVTRCPMCAMEAASYGAFTYYKPTYPDGIYPKIEGKKKDLKQT